MKIVSYKGEFVALVHNLSTSQVRIQRIKPRLVEGILNGKWDYCGLPFDVDRVDTYSITSVRNPLIGLVKTSLTQDDYNRLNAARGLDLTQKGGYNRLGRLPSVRAYNKAVLKHKLAGAPIVPVVS